MANDTDPPRRESEMQRRREESDSWDPWALNNLYVQRLAEVPQRQWVTAVVMWITDRERAGGDVGGDGGTSLCVIDRLDIS